MIIKIDIRERDLIEEVQKILENYNGIELKIETLPLGDMILEKDGKEHIIYERKSISDLLASIKDGRYEEQSYRLRGLDHPNHNIVYIIEGDVLKVPSFRGFTKKPAAAAAGGGQDKLAYSAMFSLNFFKGFSVFRTFGLQETALFLCNSASKLNRDLAEGKVPYYSKVGETAFASEIPNDSKDYVSVVKKVKKENITESNIGEIMLSQIPGVSSVTSIAILSQYKTIGLLIDALRENENCLNDLTTTLANGQQRKISKTCVASIKKFLL